MGFAEGAAGHTQLRMKAGERIHDRYKLEEPLGRGGMAEVWRAVDERLERTVAVKFLSEHFSDDPENLVRFFSEAQQIARIQHPNVVTVLEFGDHDDRPFIVMSHITGGSLSEVTGSPVEPDKALALVAGAAKGAGAAHDVGIVHRDIKPANILIDEDGTVRLADFGIAFADGAESMTQTGAAIGSPHYISPEQAKGEPATPASDVYALGIVLYELITGEKPFDAQNITGILTGHIEREPTPPHDLVPDIDPAAEAVVLRCLAKDPAQRFSDGNDLAGAIQEVRSGRADATLLAPAAAGTAEFESVDTEPTSARDPRKVAALVAAALLVIGAATAAVMMTGSGDPDGTAIAATPSPTPSKTKDKKEDKEPTAAPTSSATPTPSPTASEAQPSPTPKSSPEPKPTKTPKPTPTPTPTPTSTTASTGEPTPTPAAN